jgi:predicted nucleic acid-binding protein
VSTLRIVVTDSNVLINLIHADSLQVVGQLAGYEFVVLEEVVAEVSAPEQAAALSTAFERGFLRREVVSDLTALTLFSDLTRTMGKGEAASLAAAATFGWSIACDEKRVFLREARTRLGEGRILTTPGIFVLAIRAGLLTVEEADAIKAHLASTRFVMDFRSFQDVLTER